MNENKNFNRNPTNHALYHAPIKVMIEDENAMDKGVSDTVKNHKRQHDEDDEDPSAGPNQSKKIKRRRTKESESSMKPSTTKETYKGKAPSKGFKTNKPANAKEPIGEPSAEIKSIELEYNMKECFKALTDKLDWNNPEGDRCPFDLTKPLPLKGRPGRLIFSNEYFFNNDLEFLKSSDPEKKYTTSITKTKEARYEIVGIKDMVATLWSTTQVRYDKDAKKESSTGLKGVIFGIDLR
nr:hypothetical protein [Tanacetum cinerariifolium]